MLSDKLIIRPAKPTLYERVLQKLRAKLSKKGRYQLNQKYIREIKHRNITIISSFCGGGTLYHDMNQQFLSPTINLAFDGEDFCKFCLNLPYYLSLELEECKTDEVNYPVGKLGDVEIRFVHYESFDLAKQKWEERVKRVDLNRVLIMATDRDGMEDWLNEFNMIPYRKILYSAVPHPEFDWAVFCPEFANKPCVGVMTGIADFYGRRYYEKNIDIINLLNSL